MPFFIIAAMAVTAVVARVWRLIDGIGRAVVDAYNAGGAQ
jgi:hypothetical protein